jgi:hypothetical protein
VRIAWEIYHHQAKQNPEKASSAAGVKPESMLRPHMYPPPSSPSVRQHELTTSAGFPPSTPPSLQARPFDPLAANFLTSQGLGKFLIIFPREHIFLMNKSFIFVGVSPFGRYASPYGSPFALSPYSREMQLAGGPLDPWRR